MHTKRYLTPGETVKVHKEMESRIEIISRYPPTCRWKDNRAESEQLIEITEATGITDLTYAQFRRIRRDIFGDLQSVTKVQLSAFSNISMLEAKVDILRNDLRVTIERQDKMDEILDKVCTGLDIH